METKKGINVLSLFDGMSGGHIALDKCGIKINQYFASEIDKHAIHVTMQNYPETIQLGSVVNVNTSDLPEIDLLIGGSPCQSFSFAGKRKGMATIDETEVLTLNHYLQLKNDGFKFHGQSHLFWEYMRILNETKPKYFLLENVLMGEKWEAVLSRAIGVHPIEINSALVSAQNRRRLYWTNIGMEPMGLFGDLESIIKQPKDKKIFLVDILEDVVSEKYFLSEKILVWFENRNKINKKRGNGFFYKPKKINEKSNCINATYNRLQVDSTYIEQNKKIRKLTPIECERLQTIPDNYTNHVSDTQRYQMLGNGWTADVVAHIFSYLPFERYDSIIDVHGTGIQPW